MSGIVEHVDTHLLVAFYMYLLAADEQSDLHCWVMSSAYRG